MGWRVDRWRGGIIDAMGDSGWMRESGWVVGSGWVEEGFGMGGRMHKGWGVQGTMGRVDGRGWEKRRWRGESERSKGRE